MKSHIGTMATKSRGHDCSPEVAPIEKSVSSRNLSYKGKLPIKLIFPNFGRPEDDPTLYLEKCQDFLTLKPMSNEEILATLRSVLNGTAKDWWETVRNQVKNMARI